MANAASVKRKAPPFTFFDGACRAYRPQFTRRDGSRWHPYLRNPDGELVRDECDVRPAMIKYVRELVDGGEIDAHCGGAAFYLGDQLGEPRVAKVIPLPRGASDDISPEIPSHLYSEIASWRRVIHSARAEDARDLLRRAALDLHRFLLIVETEAPASHAIAGQLTMDALQEFAEFHLVDTDDAQLIFAEAKKSSVVTSNATTPAAPDGSLIMSKASDVAPERIEWVWPGRIARGKHTAIAGDPGAGKSQLMISIVAAVTTGGDFPCGEGRAPIGSVVILAAEDGIADTVVPRLKAAGADLERVSIITAVRGANGNGTRTFNLQADLEELSKEIAALGDVVLVCIDPVSSYVGKVDSHKNAELRGVLEPLGRMAEETRVAVLSITHFSKGGAGASTNSLYRFIGSIAFVAAPRAAFVVMLDPEDKERRLFLHSKNNLAKPAQGLAFRLAQCLVGESSDIIASHVVWDERPVSVTADEALGTGAKDEPTARDDATDFLRTVLAGGAIAVPELETSAREAGYLGAEQSISQSKPFRSARQFLGIRPHQVKGKKAGGWFWALPEDQMPFGRSDALINERASDGDEGI